MKKLFGLYAALAISASLMAANTANFVIYVESPDNNGIYDEFVAAENPEYSAAYENLRDAEKMVDANNPSLYGYVEMRQCGVIASNNLEGLLLSLKTVNEVNYDISFYNVAGTTYFLIDLESGEIVQIAEGNTMELRGVAANSTLENRFFISKNEVAPVMSLTTNELGWATFSSVIDLVAPEGLTAYKGTLSDDVLNLHAVDFIKAGEGVILKGAANETYKLAVGTGTADFAENDLKPSSAWESHSGSIYTLAGEEMVPFEGLEFPANEAYLEISASPAPESIRLDDGGSTAVDNVEAGVQAQKFVENGQIYIRRGNEVFNLQGQEIK